MNELYLYQSNHTLNCLQAALETTEKNLAELQEEQERLQTNAADALADAAAAHEASLQKHLLKFEKFQVSMLGFKCIHWLCFTVIMAFHFSTDITALQAERAEELSTLQSQISKLEAENENLETTLREQLASLTNAHDKVQALQGTVAEQQSQIGKYFVDILGLSHGQLCIIFAFLRS